MTIAVEPLSRTKAIAAILFFGGGAVWILSRPFRERGGLGALIAGEDDGRGWWPILAACALILLPMMARAAIRLARHRGPAVFIDAAGLHSYGWKRPISLAVITQVSSKRSRWLAGQPGGVTVHLADGSKKPVTPYLDASAEDVAAKLSDALVRSGWKAPAAHPPLS